MRLLDFLCALSAVTIWGLDFLAYHAVALSAPPLMSLLFELIITACITLIFYRKPPTTFLNLTMLSFCYSLLNACVLFAMKSGLAITDCSILVKLDIPMAIMINYIIFKDKIGIKVIIGTLLSITGATFFLESYNFVENATALIYVLTAGLLSATFNIIVHRAGKINPISLTGWMALFATPQLFFESLIIEHHDWVIIKSYFVAKIIFLILYIAIIDTLLAMALWCYALQRNPVHQTMPFALLMPIITAAAGVIVLHESTTLIKIVSSITILIGLGIILINPQKTNHLHH